MREKGQTEVAKTLETPVFSRGIEILTEKKKFLKGLRRGAKLQNQGRGCVHAGGQFAVEHVKPLGVGAK